MTPLFFILFWWKQVVLIVYPMNSKWSRGFPIVAVRSPWARQDPQLPPWWPSAPDPLLACGTAGRRQVRYKLGLMAEPGWMEAWSSSRPWAWLWPRHHTQGRRCGWATHPLQAPGRVTATEAPGTASTLPGGDGDDTTLMAESEEQQKGFLMKVKEESEKVGLNSTFRKLRSWHLVTSLHGR